LFRISKPHVLPAAAWDMPIVGVRFSALRAENRTHETVKYHAAAGSARQLRKSQVISPKQCQSPVQTAHASHLIGEFAFTFALA